MNREGYPRLAETVVTPEIARRRELAREGREFPLDERRERDYQTVNDRLKALQEAGKSDADILLEMLRPQLDLLPAARREIFQSAMEYRAVRLTFVKSLDACSVTRHEIVRAVFVVTDPSITNRIRNAFRSTADPKNRAHGFVVAYPEMKRAGKEDVRIIIARDDKSTIKHEILHTVDPQRRSGYDRAVDEIFAFYESKIVDGHKGDWDGLIDYVTDPHYHAEYQQDVNKASMLAFADMPKVESLTYQAWNERVREAIGNVRAEAARRGDDAARRRLARAKTLRDILNWDDLV